jgi:hypothetical protein
MSEDTTKYITLEQTWTIPTTWVKPTADDQVVKEDFGAFSISAAVRGSYCQHCGRRRYEDIPGVY